MANFPFKDATFTSYADITYPSFNYGSVYYTKINGVITAIKPIAVGIFYTKEQSRSFGSSWVKRLYCHAAGGKKWVLDLCGKPVFLTAEDAVKYEKGIRTGRVPEASLCEILRMNGARVSSEHLVRYVWCHGSGSACETTGGYMFWEDADGRHVEFQETDKNGKKLYFTREECVDDNVKVVEFEGEAPKTVGEYTIKREFTVKAETEDEANGIIDKAIREMYNEQIKEK